MNNGQQSAEAGEPKTPTGGKGLPPTPPKSPPVTPAERNRTVEGFLAFLSREDVDWAVVSQELKALAESPTCLMSWAGPLESPAEERLRKDWALLAEYLAHADRTAGVPDEVRRLLETDALARAAEAGCSSASKLRSAWLDLARSIEQERARHKKR
jgi:hypothetical protein